MIYDHSDVIAYRKEMIYDHLDAVDYHKEMIYDRYDKANDRVMCHAAVNRIHIGGASRVGDALNKED